MIRLKTLIGACVVCALVLSAVVAQSASAVGTTGFTCKEKKEPGGAGFSDAHCKSEVATGAKFEHVAIPEGTQTEGRVTNEKTASETTASTVAIRVAGGQTSTSRSVHFACFTPSATPLASARPSALRPFIFQLPAISGRRVRAMISSSF